MGPIDLDAEIERHHADAFGWALSCCRYDRDQAEDVLQTTYLEILSGGARYAGRSSVKTWLFGVIRRTAAAARRRETLRRFVPLGDILGRDEQRDPSPDPATALALSDATRRLRAALGALPRRQHELLHLVFYQDLTIAEAALVLGVSLGTARTHYERGKAALRRTLGKELAP